MIKLYNFSSYPSAILKKLCSYAFRKTGCKGSIVVKVTRGGHRVRSRCYRASWVRRFTLEGRHYTKASNGTLLKKGSVSTSGAFVIIRPAIFRDPLDMAEFMMTTILHEFVHVRDFQQSRCFGEYNKQWANRPHEMRAINLSRSLMWEGDPKLQDLILELAVEIEEG